MVLYFYGITQWPLNKVAWVYHMITRYLKVIIDLDQFYDLIGESIAKGAGERIKWSLSFTSPLKILHLPTRLNPEVILYDSNMDSINYHKEIGRMRNPGVTLGQVIHGVLWELSFHGSPETRDEESAQVKSMADGVRSGKKKPLRIDPLTCFRIRNNKRRLEQRKDCTSA